ncbi:DUF429 domain-containing protein [Psychroflexus aestuariivivens]|uniref:DUF429 domain-containing protein n=1 Tax=Psychroflexus aestuariivivens TaxID=1795040 RepID=UPI000FD6F38B|nr:DUF429 domain-containing protein [Psychroflexus aestuariivivens]
MKIAGIDSCPSGWIVILFEKNKFSALLVENITELISFHPDLDCILIDIPIGLSSENFKRNIEEKMRKFLPERGSTIFTPACRKAVYAENYEGAKSINKKVLGKSLSIQSFNISKKIKEIDLYFDTKPQSLEIYESHPEICFKQLNNNKVLMSKKTSPEGFQERFELLISKYPQLQNLYKDIQLQYPKSKVKPDDILDAMVLCVTNLKSQNNGFQFIENENKTDQKGIQIKIAF